MRIPTVLTLTLAVIALGGNAIAQSGEGTLAPRASPSFAEPLEPVVLPRAAPAPPPPTVSMPPPVTYDGRWSYVYDGGPPVRPDPRADRLRWFRFALTCIGEACDPEAGASLAPECIVDEMIAFIKDCPTPAIPPPWTNSVVR